MKFGNFNVLEPSGPLQPVTGLIYLYLKTIQLFSIVRFSMWNKRCVATWRYVSLAGSCWPFSHFDWQNQYVFCSVLQWVAARHFYFHHRNFLLLVVRPCRWACNASYSGIFSHSCSLTPVCHPSSVSVFSVKVWRACPFVCVALSCMHLFFWSLGSSKSVGKEKKLSVKTLCPALSTLWVTFLTAVCVPVAVRVS